MDLNLLQEIVTNGSPFIYRTWIRYLIVCGGTFLLFWVFFTDRLQHRRCQATIPGRSLNLDELKTSLLGIIYFVLPSVGAIPLYLAGYLKLELDVAASSPGMILLVFALLVIGADAWFYWMHRAMHDSRIYRWTHALHHRYEQPSPLAGYSFALLEGFFLGLYLPILLLFFPINVGSLAIFVLWFSFAEAYVHLGYELLPRGFASSAIGKHIGTSVFHNMHHEQPAYNFGVFFTWWDRALGTMHPEYAQRFDEVTEHALFWKPSPEAPASSK